MIAYPRAFGAPEPVESMPPAFLYDIMYQIGAPWDRGAGTELVHLLSNGRLAAPADGSERPRAVDLGCGTGANVALLALHGFDVVGVDQSRVALRRARRRVAEGGLGDRVTLVRADITSPRLDRLGAFDLVVDYGALNDLGRRDRLALATNVCRLLRPGGLFVLWGWHAPRQSLRLLSFRGPSRLVPHFEPGEVERLFGDAFDIVRLSDPPPSTNAACFLLTRRPI